MHPFYESQARLLAGRPVPASGLVSMAAYLATAWECHRPRTTN